MQKQLTCVNCSTMDVTEDEGTGLVEVVYDRNEWSDSMGSFPGVKYRNGWYDIAGTPGVLCPNCARSTTIDLTRLL